jgi:hypothetical protein
VGAAETAPEVARRRGDEAGRRDSAEPPLARLAPEIQPGDWSRTVGEGAAEPGLPPTLPQVRAAAVERGLRTPAAAGIAGLLFSILFVASLALLYRRPAAGATADEIASWYLGNDARTLGLVGLYLAPFAGITFLWFVAAVRDRIGSREDRFFATAFLGSGILFVAMLFAAAAAAGAPFAAVRFQHAPPPAPDVFVYARGLAYTLLYVYGFRAAAVFMITASTIGLRTRAMPRWLGFLGIATALVLLFSVSYVRGFVFLFPAWVTIVSIELLAWSRAHRAVTG